MGHHRHNEHKLMSTVRGAIWLLLFPGLPILMATAMATVPSSPEPQPQANEPSIPSAVLDVDPFTPAPLSEWSEDNISVQLEYPTVESTDEHRPRYWS